MKNFLTSVALIVALYVGAFFVVSSTGEALDLSSYEVMWVSAGVDCTWDKSADSLIGADTLVLLNNWTPKRTGYYIFQHGALTGPDNDACTLQVQIRDYDTDDNLIGTLNTDSINTSTYALGEAIYLPFNTKIIGEYYDVDLIAVGTPTGDTVIVPNSELRVTKPTVLQANYEEDRRWRR